MESVCMFWEFLLSKCGYQIDCYNSSKGSLYMQPIRPQWPITTGFWNYRRTLVIIIVVMSTKFQLRSCSTSWYWRQDCCIYVIFCSSHDIDNNIDANHHIYWYWSQTLWLWHRRQHWRSCRAPIAQSVGAPVSDRRRALCGWVQLPQLLQKVFR